MIFDLDNNELNNNWLYALRLLKEDTEESREELERMENNELVDIQDLPISEED